MDSLGIKVYTTIPMEINFGSNAVQGRIYQYLDQLERLDLSRSKNLLRGRDAGKFLLAWLPLEKDPYGTVVDSNNFGIAQISPPDFTEINDLLDNQ